MYSIREFIQWRKPWKYGKMFVTISTNHGKEKMVIISSEEQLSLLDRTQKVSVKRLRSKIL